jgi:hypothetical protein
MCLYPRHLDNNRYKPNNKNGGRIPALRDLRLLTVSIPCGNCIECRQSKARAWRVRLCEEIKDKARVHFVTLTFNTPSLVKLLAEIQENDKTIYGYHLDNQVVKLAVRRFRERWRKRTGKSIKHWLVSELGKEGTEHVHVHGFLWTENPSEIAATWAYGYTRIGAYVNERTVNYCVKYVTKTDELHRHYKPIILTTPGIGRRYLDTDNARGNRFHGDNTRQHYTTRQGIKINLPKYLRDKIYTDDEREQLRIQALDKGTTYILGEEVRLTDNDGTYQRTLRAAQVKNIRLGYRTNRTDETERELENTRRTEIHHKRQTTYLDKVKGKD